MKYLAVLTLLCAVSHIQAQSGTDHMKKLTEAGNELTKVNPDLSDEVKTILDNINTASGGLRIIVPIVKIFLKNPRDGSAESKAYDNFQFEFIEVLRTAPYFQSIREFFSRDCSQNKLNPICIVQATLGHIGVYLAGIFLFIANRLGLTR